MAIDVGVGVAVGVGMTTAGVAVLAGCGWVGVGSPPQAMKSIVVSATKQSTEPIQLRPFTFRTVSSFYG